MTDTRDDFSTCDLCDEHKGGLAAQGASAIRVLPPVFRSFGARQRFAGRVSTVKCFEDNTLVKAAVESPGAGRVLVVDGGGSLRRALVGGNLAAAGRATAGPGWSSTVACATWPSWRSPTSASAPSRRFLCRPTSAAKASATSRCKSRACGCSPVTGSTPTPTASSSCRQRRPRGASATRALPRVGSGYFLTGSTARATASTKVAWIWSPTLISLNWPASGTLKSTVCLGP
jgi:hypothetical protein